MISEFKAKAEPVKAESCAVLVDEYVYIDKNMNVVNSRQNAMVNLSFSVGRYPLNFGTYGMSINTFAYKKWIPTSNFMKRKTKTVSCQPGLRWCLDQISSYRHGCAGPFLDSAVDEASPAECPV